MFKSNSLISADSLIRTDMFRLSTNPTIIAADEPIVRPEQTFRISSAMEDLWLFFQQSATTSIPRLVGAETPADLASVLQLAVGTKIHRVQRAHSLNQQIYAYDFIAIAYPHGVECSAIRKTMIEMANTNAFPSGDVSYQSTRIFVDAKLNIHGLPLCKDLDLVSFELDHSGVIPQATRTHIDRFAAIFQKIISVLDGPRVSTLARSNTFPGPPLPIFIADLAAQRRLDLYNTTPLPIDTTNHFVIEDNSAGSSERML